MCGISGFLKCNADDTEESFKNSIDKMNATLVRRGPDNDGCWYDMEAGIAFGHRRLSIIDVSPEGNEPMISASGRYIITYNGEIYNYRELRQELETTGWRFRGHSDTEVMLAAFEKWGLENSVKRFIGMFAFALWDRLERQLSLVRDRIGEKPLYYGWFGNTFLFASELKALRAYPGFYADIDRDSVALFMRYAYIPAPYSIYKGIKKLVPGTIITITAKKPGYYPQPVPYWSFKQVAEAGLADLYAGSEDGAIVYLDNLLKDVIKHQMISDVPLGAFLSGGIDSSTIVALMQAQSSVRVKTFSIGFYEQAYNEAQYAREVAAYLGTEHTELYVTPEQAMGVIPCLPELYDEPFADSSQIPTCLVAALARQKVAVSLSGDAGDELFGGYNRYFWGRSIWNKVGWIPRPLRLAGAGALRILPPAGWDKIFAGLEPVLPEVFRQRLPGDKVHKLAEVLAVRSPEAMYRNLVSTWKKPQELVIGATEPVTVLTEPRQWADISDFTLRMMYLDTLSYLPDDILVKVDRACMGVSLESRVPFLDHRVVEFAWQLPLEMKIRNGEGKWILRQVLYKYVPRELIDRPKMGFGVPIDSWLRGPLKEWAEDLINENRLLHEGFFQPEMIKKIWAEHLSGIRNWQYYLWPVLMFQAWREKY
jgi:asparagine synthase (glutamine-hydrolysing)